MSADGASCSWNWQCKNNACGRDENTSSKKCCSTGKYITSGLFDYCAGYGGGSGCSLNEQCMSGACLPNPNPKAADKDKGGGVCACPGAHESLCECESLCKCVDLQTNDAHCGECGTSCGAAGDNDVCKNGHCTCIGSIICNGKCSKLDDPENCGACGKVCKKGTVCLNGACSCAVPGQTVCNGACSTLDDDPANCGACGNVCNPAQRCVNSACACVERNYGDCTGSKTCLLLDGNENCGFCGIKCGVNSTCTSRDNGYYCAPNF